MNIGYSIKEAYVSPYCIDAYAHDIRPGSEIGEDE